MQQSDELILMRDVNATVIPAGEEHVLKGGTRASISQALGGTVTIRTDSGLYRLSSKEWDALGEAVAAQLKADAQAQNAASADDASAPFGEEMILSAMKQCFDPEIPVNIVDLGLIYDLQVSSPDADGRHSVQVKMTLTAQGCGMGPVIADDARQRIEALDLVSGATIDIVWDPPWTPHMISEAGRMKLGLE